MKKRVRIPPSLDIAQHIAKSYTDRVPYKTIVVEINDTFHLNVNLQWLKFMLKKLKTAGVIENRITWASVIREMVAEKEKGN